ncbi:hypothetical protein [Sulfitobacter litoralis]|uniref:hypothetical protein n=1 Tax=Sulfitobacter litoralis TaxID=335975 RepID=UPI002B277C6B|nr:hypothetical protein [Sulfitobacter litoralis]
MERFEAEHPLRDALDEPMILLEDIVQIFDLQDCPSSELLAFIPTENCLPAASPLCRNDRQTSAQPVDLTEISLRAGHKADSKLALHHNKI